MRLLLILVIYDFILSARNSVQGTSAATACSHSWKEIIQFPGNYLVSCDFPDVDMDVTRNYVEKAMPKSCVEPLFPKYHPPPTIFLSVCLWLRLSLSLSACVYIISTLELFCVFRFSFICIHLCMYFAPTDSSWNLIPVPSGKRDLREGPNVHSAVWRCLSCSHSQES